MMHKNWLKLAVLFCWPIISKAQLVIPLFDKVPNSITSKEVWEKFAPVISNVHECFAEKE